MGVVSSGSERGVYVNSAKQGWIFFIGSIPVTSSLETSSSETCNVHILNQMEWNILIVSVTARRLQFQREQEVQTGANLHVVHHHFIGQVRSELSFVDFLVEQRLERQTKPTVWVITVTNTWRRYDVQLASFWLYDQVKTTGLSLLFGIQLGSMPWQYLWKVGQSLHWSHTLSPPAYYSHPVDCTKQYPVELIAFQSMREMLIRNCAPRYGASVDK